MILSAYSKEQQSLLDKKQVVPLNSVIGHVRGNPLPPNNILVHKHDAHTHTKLLERMELFNDGHNSYDASRGQIQPFWPRESIDWKNRIIEHKNGSPLECCWGSKGTCKTGICSYEKCICVQKGLECTHSHPCINSSIRNSNFPLICVCQQLVDTGDGKSFYCMLGVRALQFIPRGTIVGIFAGDLKFAENHSPYALKVYENTVGRKEGAIEPIPYGNTMCLVNAPGPNETGNVKVFEMFSQSKPYMAMVTSRAITENEFLLYDYGKEYYEEHNLKPLNTISANIEMHPSYDMIELRKNLLPLFLDDESKAKVQRMVHAKANVFAPIYYQSKHKVAIKCGKVISFDEETNLIQITVRMQENIDVFHPLYSINETEDAANDWFVNNPLLGNTFAVLNYLKLINKITECPRKSESHIPSVHRDDQPPKLPSSPTSSAFSRISSHSSDGILSETDSEKACSCCPIDHNIEIIVPNLPTTHANVISDDDESGELVDSCFSDLLIEESSIKQPMEGKNNIYSGIMEEPYFRDLFPLGPNILKDYKNQPWMDQELYDEIMLMGASYTQVFQPKFYTLINEEYENVFYKMTQGEQEKLRKQIEQWTNHPSSAEHTEILSIINKDYLNWTHSIVMKSLEKGMNPMNSVSKYEARRKDLLHNLFGPPVMPPLNRKNYQFWLFYDRKNMEQVEEKLSKYWSPCQDHSFQLCGFCGVFWRKTYHSYHMQIHLLVPTVTTHKRCNKCNIVFTSEKFNNHTNYH